jgi:drug/metabolite transporter (DMT)-like permease
MDIAVAGAVLAAALLHATWHALVKSSDDGVVALAGMNVVSGVVALCFLPFVRLPALPVLAVIAGSVVLHAGYKVALARLYRGADLGRAYPIARGLTPLIATGLAAMILKELPDAVRLAGIGLISAGVLGLVYERRGQPLQRSLIIAAVAAGAAVAAYSVLDAYGVRLSGDWVGFTAWLVACDSAAFIGYSLLSRPHTVTAWRASWGRVLVSGMLGVTSFSVFMWALGRVEVGSVTALRETSVMFAALLGALVLGERATWVRFASAGLVAAGAGVIALSGGRL